MSARDIFEIMLIDCMREAAFLHISDMHFGMYTKSVHKVPLA